MHVPIDDILLKYKYSLNNKDLNVFLVDLYQV